MPPIRPEEVSTARSAAIPEVVFVCFNNLIARNIRDGEAIVSQREVIDLIIKKSSFSPDDLFQRGWLDIEKDYQEAGWRVKYDKPGYNETYEATFTFTAKRKKS